MRLTQLEIDAFITVISDWIKANNAELRLFGSRADDQKKGGDIDVLLLIHSDALKKDLISHKHVILSEIQTLIGEQKIDLKIALYDEIESDDFLQLIHPSSICLHKWAN